MSPARTPPKRAAERLSAAAARRIALAAQGFTDPRPTGRIDRRHLRRLFDRVGVLQIDSVNVLVRAHELPAYSRLGPYPREALWDLAYYHGELFEYWGHEASLIPVEMHPFLRFKMQAAVEGKAGWQGLLQVRREKPGYVEAVFEEVRDRGPLTAAELTDPGRKAGPWWGWNHGKQALEYLFWCGRVTARRRPPFEREYDLPERVLPAAVLDAPTPPETVARAALVMRAARSLGVATAADLADYYRLKTLLTRPVIDALVSEGQLLPVEVEGWGQQAYLHPEAKTPRRVQAAALVSPFDSLLWNRDRTMRLFDFHLRIEIYTPAPKRTYGYYVLPFLLGEELVARVDVKADRHGSRLLAPGLFLEAGVDPTEVAGPLAAELHRMAAWLGLERVVVGERGDLAGAVAREIAAAGTGASAG